MIHQCMGLLATRWDSLAGVGVIKPTGSTDFAGKHVIPNEMRNPSGVNRSCFTAGMLRSAQHDNVNPVKVGRTNPLQVQ